MRLFLRALLLSALSMGAVGSGVLVVFSSLPSNTDPSSLAVQTFLALAALIFGAYALLQAKQDYTDYKKANPKPEKIRNAALILAAVLVLVFAGYKAWQSTQPIDVTITYMNATTEKPIAGATLYFRDDTWSVGKKPQVRQVMTDESGKVTISVGRDTYYTVYDKQPNDRVSGLEQINPYGVAGSQLEMRIYAGQTTDRTHGRSDVFVVKVVNEQGQALKDAKVEFFTSAATSTTVQTDASGQAELADNAYEPVSVLVSKEGFQSKTEKADRGVLTLVMLSTSQEVMISST